MRRLVKYFLEHLLKPLTLGHGFEPDPPWRVALYEMVFLFGSVLQCTLVFV